jgi:alcohol dehydrogenase class IV
VSAALNAFAMAVDGLQSSVDDPLAEALLLHGLRLLATWLPRLGQAPGDAEPRLRLMTGALLVGQGSDHVGGGLAQALSHAAGPRSSVANGVVEALLLPHTMRFNAPVTRDRLSLVSEALASAGANAPSSVDGAVGEVERVLAAAGAPARLRDVGVDPDDVDVIVDRTLDDWAITRVPRPADRGQLVDLLRQAW